ncbi:hypothetical protein HQ563_03440 [bacterium]|nr:hypothetical protein [bacterium]
MSSRGDSDTKLDEELLCIRCLEQHLRTRLPDENISWERLQRGKDPPDFWLSMGTRRFAVEVTSLVEILQSGPPEVSEICYWACLTRLAKQVEAEAAQQGVLKGTYILSAHQMPPLPTGKDQKAFVDACVRHVRETMHKRGMQPEMQVWPGYDAAVKVAIYKLSDDGASLGIGGHSPSKSGPSVTQKLTELLRGAISEKRIKLENKSVHDSCEGVILALYDCYGFPSEHDFHRCIKVVKDAGWFHSIFVVRAFVGPGWETEAKGWFIQTREPSWD